MNKLYGRLVMNEFLNKFGRCIFSSWWRQIISTLIILAIIVLIILLTSTFTINISLLIISFIFYISSFKLTNNYTDDLIRLISYVLIIISFGSLWKDAFINSDFNQLKTLSALSIIFVLAMIFLTMIIKNKSLNK